ncbi:MAG: flippase-like domain-containing protein [bacterium]|nr:flippase-like domain-containing protein [bacterium]
MKLRIIATITILLALIVIIYKSVNLNQLTENISRFPPILLYVALALAIVLTFIKTWRLRVLLKKNRIEPAFWPAYKLFIASQALTALPGGEASRAYLVTKETDASIHQAATPVFLQAMLELFSAISIVIFCSLFYTQLLAPGIIALVLMISFVAIVTNAKILTFLLNKGSRWELINSHQDRIVTIQKELVASIFRSDSYLPSNAIVKAFTLGLLTNLVGGILVKVIASGYDQNVSLFNSIFVYAGGVAIQGLSTISPGGLGFTEGGMTGMLHLFGTSNALEIVLIYRFVTFIFYTLIGLLFILLFYRKELLFKKAKKE